MLGRIEELAKMVDLDCGDKIENISGVDFDILIENIFKQSLDFQKKVLSQEKFIDHPELNKQGLHLFRAVASELSVIDRRFSLGYSNHPLYDQFLKDGILVLRDKYHWFELADGDMWSLLSMCAGKKVEPQAFRVNELIHQDGDIQNELHTDIFQPNVKSWMYLQDIRLEHGPTYYIYGSHINDERKLKYLYYMSNLPAGHEDIREGSFPLKDYDKWGYESPRSVTGPKGTYFICDTSGFHSRGYAKPGTKRTTAKLHYRFNPFYE